VHGAGKGSDDLVMITLGTGIGCSVIIQGRPLRGKHFQAGVLGGHMIADPDGPACPACPAVGCYETESGSLSLPRLAKADQQFSTSALSTEATIDYAVVFRLATAGDALATQLRDRAIRYWAALAVSLIHAYDPDRIIIGGAVSRDADVILPVMQETVNHQAWVTAPVTLCAAELGNDAGLIGAATLFQKEIQCL
jgi:glucokinase